MDDQESNKFYKSRFLLEYYPNSVQRFLNVYTEIEKTDYYSDPITKLQDYALSMISIVLPNCPYSKDVRVNEEMLSLDSSSFFTDNNSISLNKFPESPSLSKSTIEDNKDTSSESPVFFKEEPNVIKEKKLLSENEMSDDTKIEERDDDDDNADDDGDGNNDSITFFKDPSFEDKKIKEEQQYIMAIDYRNKFFKTLLSHNGKNLYSLLETPGFASKFVNIIMDNLLGNIREFERCVEQKKDLDYIVPLWSHVINQKVMSGEIEPNFKNLLSTFYRLILFVIKQPEENFSPFKNVKQQDVETKSLLLKKFRQETFLMNLARLLQSPNWFECVLVKKIFRIIASKSFNYRPLRRAMKNIFMGAFEDLKNHDNEISLRPIPHLLDLLRKIILYNWAAPERRAGFLEIAQKMAIPLINMSNYPYYSNEYFELIHALLAAAFETNQQTLYLELGSSIIRALTKKVDYPYDLIPAPKLIMIFSLFVDNSLHTSLNLSLFKSLFTHTLYRRDKAILMATVLFLTRNAVRNKLFSPNFKVQGEDSLEIIERIAKFLIDSSVIPTASRDEWAGISLLVKDLCKESSIITLIANDEKYGMELQRLCDKAKDDEDDDDDDEPTLQTSLTTLFLSMDNLGIGSSTSADT